MHILTLIFLFSASSFAQELPPATFSRLEKLYPDQSREFMQERLANAPAVFNKWRSFPPYYYEMLTRSSVGKGLTRRSGLCAGDPHLENFGFIANGKSPEFTLNDLDDVTKCSLDADLMRLFIGHKFLKADLSAESFLAHYQKGFSAQECVAPSFINELFEDSVKKDRGLSKKNKALLESKTCEGEYSPLTKEEEKLLNDFVSNQKSDLSCDKPQVLNTDIKKVMKVVNPTSIVHACARIKESGGSAGGKRFVVFAKSASNEIDAFELKPLNTSAPDFKQALSTTKRKEVYQSAVKTYLGEDMSAHYYPVILNKKLYQRRPLWAGNEDVKEKDIDKSAPSEKAAIMLYETCKLGRLHAKSNPTALKMDPQEWERMAQALSLQFRSEFGHK